MHMNRNEPFPPRVSVLIPVYNRETYIETCVRSAMRQTVRDIEIVIVDNASTDGTWPILERLAAEDRRIRIFRNERNLGAVPNWRRCMEEARAPIGKLLFSDDTIQQDYLERTLPWLDREDVGFVFSAVRIGTNAQEREGGDLWYQSYAADGIYASAEFIEGALEHGAQYPVSPGCALMRLEDLKRNLRLSLPGTQVTDFDRHGAGPDLLLYLLTATQYPSFGYVREPLCFFRHHPGSITVNDPQGHIQRSYGEAKAWFRREVLGYAEASGAASTTTDPDARAPGIREGERLFATGDLSGAESVFLGVLVGDPGNAAVKNDLGVLYHQREDYPRALRYLTEALEHDSADRDVVRNMCTVLCRLGQIPTADNLLEAYLRRNPADTELRAERERMTAEEGGVGGDAGGEVRPAVGAADAGRKHARSVDWTRPDRAACAPMISIVVPSFNQGRFLEEAICSVLDQGYPRLELIVMDGGSSDGSLEIIRQYEDRIAYWRTGRDQGQYWAVDEGFRHCTGEIMTWINSDDRFHAGAFRTVASIFSQAAEVDWVTGVPTMMNEAGQQIWTCSPVPVYSRRHYLDKQYMVPRYIQQEGTFWRRSLWERAGGRLKTSLRMAGDLELWMRFFRCACLYTVDRPLGCFRRHAGQRTADNLALYHAEAIRELEVEARRFTASGEAVPDDPPVITVQSEAADGPGGSAGSGVNAGLRKAVVTGGRGGLPGPNEKPAEVVNRDDTQILVSAIVSTYNSERYLQGCLEDLEAQTLSDRLEIIVVDSGSQQRERWIVEDFQKHYENIRYIRTEERETVYAAWNRGIQAARGRYLTNANTDDRHRRDAFERMVGELERNPDISVVYADSKVTRQENATFDEARIEACFKWPEFEPRGLFSVCYLGPQPMWRRSLHERYGGFDASLKVAGDYDFWLRLATAERFRHIPELLGLYFSSPGSVEHALAGVGAQESERVRERNWPQAWGERPPPGGSFLVPIGGYGEGTAAGAGEGPLVSIIMPTRDRLGLLGRALDSVIAQHYCNWELVVVNDGGESVRPIVEGRDSAGRIRVVELDQSAGQAKARTLAFVLARGEIICYLDDDDLYLRDHLQTVVGGLAIGGHDFVYTDAVVVTETLDGGAVQEVSRDNPYAHDRYSRERLLVGNYIPINTWAHRRECLDAVGVFDDTLSCYEDWEFLLRLSAQYEPHRIARTTVEVRHRVDRVDNVSRRRLADTVQAYRSVYRAHDIGLTADLQCRREETLRRLEANVVRHQAEGGGPPIGVDEPVLPGTVFSARAARLCTERMRSAWKSQPAIHLLVTHDSGREQALADTLDALASQIYAGWGLSVVSRAPCPDPMFEALPNLKWVQVEGRLMEGVNRLAEGTSVDWIGLLEAGDTLEPDMLYRCIDFLQDRPDCRLIYMDEDRIDAAGGHHDPQFKPDFNLELLRSMPYMGRCLLVRRDALNAAGGYAADERIAAYELALRVSEAESPQAIGHIPWVLVHHQDRFRRAHNDDEVGVLRRRALAGHLARVGIDAVVRDGNVAGTFFVDYAAPADTPQVEIFMDGNAPTQVLSMCLEHLIGKTDYPAFRINLLVPEGREPGCPEARHERVALMRYDARQGCRPVIEACVKATDAPYLLFLRAGVIVLQGNWLARLLGPMQRTEVAVTAPRLVSTGNRVLDGGILLGGGGCSVGAVAHGGLALGAPGYMGRAQVAQELGAVSDNCLLIRTDTYRAVGGFSPTIETPLYRAVDLGRRVIAGGGMIVWTPHATLLYVEAAASEADRLAREQTADRESQAVCERWLLELARDPAYNPNLSLRAADFRVPKNLPFPAVFDSSRPKILGFGVGSFGSWKYRVDQPLDALHREGLVHRFLMDFPKNGVAQLPTSAELERLEVDALLFHNTVHDYTLDALRLYRRVNHAFVVLGEDDLMTALPPKNPFSKTVYKDIRRRLRRACELADRVVVTTEPLAEALQRYSGDVRVVPNRLPTEVWGMLRRVRRRGARPRVGWAGAPQHHGDLELLREVVEATANEVDWVFFGMCPGFLQAHVCEMHDPVAFDAYPEKLASLDLDLALAPLELNDFNRCKSNLRLLEYGVLGWPVIASDIEPYRDAPVCRARNQARAWIRAIRERIHEPEAAVREGEALREWVLANGMLEDHLADWSDVLTPGAAAGGRDQRRQSSG
jgi:glycosyltransferase involved in cell wall biosynthesis